MNAEPAAPPKKPPTPTSWDEPRPVKTLYFRGPVDLPTETGVARLQTGERKDSGMGTKPRYECSYLPRIDKYLVRAFEARTPKLLSEFTIPGDWAVAEFGVAP